jgi:outer membrane protein
MTKLWIPTLLWLALWLPNVNAAQDLIQVYQLAEKQDPQFRSIQAAYRATLQQMPQARGRLWLPMVNFGLNAQTSAQDITGEGFGGGSPRFESYNWSLDLTQPVFHWDRVVAVRQADSRIRQAEFDVNAALQELMVRVSERYFDMLAAIDNLEFARAEKEALARQLDQTKQRFEVGLIAITDVQESQAGYDLAFAEEIRSQNLLDNTIEALREITGEYHRNIALLGASMPLVSPEPADIDQWTESALSNNMTLASATAQATTAAEEINRQSASGHLPSVDIVGSHSFALTGGRFGSTEIDDSRIGFQLNVPIYEGGQAISRTQEARERYNESLERLELTRRAAVRETRGSYLGVMSGISRVKALNQAVISTETAVEATEAGFDVGTRTSVDVVTAKRELFRAKRDYSRARYDYILDILRLKQAAGSLAAADLIQVNAWLDNK